MIRAILLAALALTGCLDDEDAEPEYPTCVDLGCKQGLCPGTTGLCVCPGPDPDEEPRYCTRTESPP